MSFPLFDRNRLVQMGIVKKKVRKIEKRASTEVAVAQSTPSSGNQATVSKYEASSEVTDSHCQYPSQNLWPESRMSVNQPSPPSNNVNTTKWSKPVASIRTSFAGRNSSFYVYSKYTSSTPVSYGDKRLQPYNSPMVRKRSSQKSRSSQHYSIPKMTQSAFDQILPLSTPKRQSRGGKLSSLLSNVIREKQYQTTVSRLLSFSGDDYFEQQEYSVDSETLRSSYSAWGTQVIRVSQSTSIAVRQKEGPIMLQSSVSTVNQSRQMFRLVSSPVKVDSYGGVSIIGGYVKV